MYVFCAYTKAYSFVFYVNITGTQKLVKIPLLSYNIIYNFDPYNVLQGGGRLLGIKEYLIAEKGTVFSCN